MDNIPIISLKKVCKILNINNISKITKDTKLIYLKDANEKLAVLKIQRWFRNLKLRGEKCAISLEPISYPCYAFKAGKGVLNYYNLKVLKKYLIESGNFTDPLSRMPYTDEQFNVMDEMDKYYRSYKTHDDVYVSVLKASKNKKFYTKKYELECEIITLERVLDLLCQDIIKYLTENDESINNILHTNNIDYALNMIYLYNYRIHIERLYIRDTDHAIYSIDKNIGNFLTIVEHVDQTKIETYLKVLNYLDNLKNNLEK